MKQTQFFKFAERAYGGSLLTTRKGRANGRPLSTRATMHLVLRSSKARGGWSFRNPKHDRRIRQIVAHFAAKNGVRVLSFANVGNHLHLHIRLGSRHGYRPFIRAVTASIAMAVSGVSRWRPDGATATAGRAATKFWDRRPFTRILSSWRENLTLRDYIRVNTLEGLGLHRINASLIIAREKDLLEGSPPPESSG